MANTTTIDGTVIHIALDGATLWSLASDMEGFANGGLLVKSITWEPDVAGGECKIRNGSATAAYFFSGIGTAQQLRDRQNFGEGKRFWPYLLAADTAAGELIIQLA